MYFSRLGEVCVRYTGTDWNEDDLPALTRTYDYDDEFKWPLAALRKEERRVTSGKDFDMNALFTVQAEISRRGRMEEPDTTGDWDKVIEMLEAADDMWYDPDLDDEEWDDEERRPIIFTDTISLPTRKLIRDVANAEREELAFSKENRQKEILKDGQIQIDEKNARKFAALYQKGLKAREALMNSDLGD